MADIKIESWVIRTDETQTPPKASLIGITSEGKEIEIETRYMASDDQWRVAPMDIIMYDENAPIQTADTKNIDDPNAPQPPAASFANGSSADQSAADQAAGPVSTNQPLQQ